MKATRRKTVEPRRVVNCLDFQHPRLKVQPDNTICEWCLEAPPRVKLSLSDLHGKLLDDAVICADCARGVNLEPGA